MTNKELYYFNNSSNSSSYHYSKSFLPNVFKVCLIAVFLLFVFRSISNFGVSDDPSLYFNHILAFFGNNSFSNDFLFSTLRNFSDISNWFSSDNLILSFFGNFVEILAYIANMVLVLVALLLQAINALLLVFDILFVIS